MAVHGDQALAVVYENRVAVKKDFTGIDDTPAGRRRDRCTFGSRKIQSTMGFSGLLIEKTSQPERAADRALDRQRKMQGVRSTLVPGGECLFDAPLFSSNALHIPFFGIDHALVFQGNVLAAIGFLQHRKIQRGAFPAGIFNLQCVGTGFCCKR